jgi:phosphatidylglycerophosphatase C
VLVSAALDVYVEPVAELLGATAAISTVVEVTGDRCTGRLIDADLHDERKVERLQAWLGPREPSVTVYAYGNSEDDDEMAAYAERTQRRPAPTAS